MSDLPKFSIIMAAYNAEKFIEKAIDSVIHQKYENWELIIVDDGSKDNTAIIVDRYSKQDDRILVIHQQNGGSAAAARKKALTKVTGDYIQILDSDDMLKEDLLFEYSDKIRQTEADIVIPNCIYFGKEDVLWEKKGYMGNYSIELDGFQGFYASLDWSIHGFFCVKTSLVKQIDSNDKLINDDEFFTRRMLFASKKIVFVDSTYYFRQNLNSTTQSEANSVRMFECLITDYNIYKFSLNEKMPKYCINRAYKLLCWSLISHEQKFERIKNMISNDDASWIYGVIKDVYKKTIRNILNQPLNIYSFFIISSLGLYPIFYYQNKLIAIFRRLSN